MILIMNNGGCYSDRRIYFIDCDGMDPDEVSRLVALTCTNYGDQKPFEIARADSLDWRNPSSMSKPEDAIDELDEEDVEAADLPSCSDRALSILAAKTYETDARDRIAAEQLRRES